MSWLTGMIATGHCPGGAAPRGGKVRKITSTKGVSGALAGIAILLVYSLTSYGGVRSPDAEVIFETCEALAHRGAFAVDPVSSWTGFGLAPGRDGALY